MRSGIHRDFPTTKRIQGGLGVVVLCLILVGFANTQAKTEQPGDCNEAIIQMGRYAKRMDAHMGAKEYCLAVMEAKTARLWMQRMDRVCSHRELDQICKELGIKAKEEGIPGIVESWDEFKEFFDALTKYIESLCRET